MSYVLDNTEDDSDVFPTDETEGRTETSSLRTRRRRTIGKRTTTGMNDCGITI